MAEEEAITQKVEEPDKPGFFTRLRRRDERVRVAAEVAGTHRPFRWRLFRRVIVIVVVAVALYYPAGMIAVHKIDDDTGFQPAVTAGQSRAAAVMAGLLSREIETHGWTANDPFFLPSSQLDNMPNYQLGIVAALARFTIEMADHIGRASANTNPDPDLERARELLGYAGTVWVFSFKTWSGAPPSEQQYLAARDALLAYNKRLAANKAVFDRRAPKLQATLARIATDLGTVAGQLEARVTTASGAIIDTRSDDVFYSAKGRIYAYYLILRALGLDYAKVLREKQLEKAWPQMLASLKRAAEIKPFIVRNGAPDSFLQPNHLAAQGLYLLRARSQLREIAGILLK
ncbi:MAG TPA: DUF2333 family protein [Alphaproteobacteria bacterium]|nr:DUF2333 family protein [Alphaproteobacteria bacterium]